MIIKNLYEELKSKAYDLDIVKPRIPDFVVNNLKHTLFDWQEKALINLLTYNEIIKKEKLSTPTHLMFNMATGTGKTLVMGASMLYYYDLGYRNFIFIVNQNNIISKTESNFCNPFHGKYLFKEKILINGISVKIKMVHIFSKSTNDIEIKFTTVQKLYNDIHLERENQIILDDLLSKDIVILADEAHHLNAMTKVKGKQIQLDLNTEMSGNTSLTDLEKRGWEHTVVELLLNRNGSVEPNKNILLEFTATIPSDKSVTEKYSDKIIYKFGLKEFLSAGYTKEINLISSSFGKKERILQALLFSWYRESIADKYALEGNQSLTNFKPVILFRSRTIEESKSDFEFYINIINNLSVADFDFLNKLGEKIDYDETVYERGKSRTYDVLNYINVNKISYSKLVDNMKYAFSKEKCIITNSESNTTKKEKTDEETDQLLNNLEDRNNTIRCIFTVERLTEGWDVLNLYDIVRLYQGQNSGGNSKKTPESTVKEKQLIGRGVRYYPFEYKDKISNKRKFDNDIENELRILEELHYYTFDEQSRYISHLKAELKKDGYIKDDRITKTFDLKKEFRGSNYFNNISLLVNEKKSNPKRRKMEITEISYDFMDPYKVSEIDYIESHFSFTSEADINTQTSVDDYQTSIKYLGDFERQLFFKAINLQAVKGNSLYKFKHLKLEMKLETIDELLQDAFLGRFQIPIVSSISANFDSLSNQIKLAILGNFLEKFEIEFLHVVNPFKGSEFFPIPFNTIFKEKKTKILERDLESDEMEKRLISNDWYVLDSFYGTSIERELILEITNLMANLKEKYDEIYLLRNEEVYKIFDFSTGRGFQPDFILLLSDKNKQKCFYQIFIEPKGEHLVEKDEWKNQFLMQINQLYGLQKDNILEHNGLNYYLIGLPLYSVSNKSEFVNELSKLYSS